MYNSPPSKNAIALSKHKIALGESALHGEERQTVRKTVAAPDLIIRSGRVALLQVSDANAHPCTPGLWGNDQVILPGWAAISH